MSEQKKAPPPSLFDSAQPRTSIKVLQQNKSDYIARKKVWGIAFISFCMGCVLATTGAWFLISSSTSSIDSALQADPTPPLSSVDTNSTPIVKDSTPTETAVLESSLENTTAVDNRKNPLDVFKEEQVTKPEEQLSPSNPFKVLEKDNSVVSAKKPATKTLESSRQNRQTEQKNTKRETEAAKRRAQETKVTKTQKVTPQPTTTPKKTENKQPPQKQPKSPDAIEELIKKL